MAVEDCVWIVDVLTLRPLAITTAQSEREIQLWIAFLRQLLCSEAIKLGSSHSSHTLSHLNNHLHSSGFSIRGDLRIIADVFPDLINELRDEVKGIICLHTALLRVSLTKYAYVVGFYAREFS